MKHQLLVTPSGTLRVRETDVGDCPADLAASFARSPAEGLFSLAVQPLPSEASAALEYWQQFGHLFLAELCSRPVGAKIEAIDAPRGEQMAALLRGVPPMLGAEYVTHESLTKLWQELDESIRTQISKHRDGLAGFLADRAPQWHQVGRVAFHLAENKRDSAFPFAFLATYSPGVTTSARTKYQPLSKALHQYAGEKNKEVLLRLLSPVHRASEQSTLIAALVESGDIFHALAWTPAEAHQFLKEAPIYEASGVLVRLPDWWRQRPRPRVGVTIGEQRRKMLGTDTMLDFRVSVALGDQQLSERDWQELLNTEDGLVLFKGNWVEVDHEKLTAALAHWEEVRQASEEGELSFAEGMRLLAGAPRDLASDDSPGEEERQWSFVTAGGWLRETLEKLRDGDDGDIQTMARGLQATLRGYQRRGVDWLWRMSQLGLGACLADDMGLGKTIQVIALLLIAKEKHTDAHPALLVLPASLLANWKSELERFAPSLRALYVHPSELDKEQLQSLAGASKKERDRKLSTADAVFTTYGMLQRQSWLLDTQWSRIVLDEAQAIKNPSAKQTRTVKRLAAYSRITLTGTPVENRLGDLWSLFDFLCPGLLGSAAQFKALVRMLEKRPHDRYSPLRELIQPYILRRLKTDKSIITDLPDKSEVTAFCNLTKRQAVLYERSVQELTDAIDQLEGIKRRGLVLSFLMRFKQICNHPSQLTGDGEYDPQQSGKFQRLAEICEEIGARQERALVFTQFREMTEPLSAFLREVFGRAGLVLHGGTAVGKRKKIVDQFQLEDGPPFLVLSLKAGGTGLNLTAASHVIHFDRWWNPAVENQATDRAFRIGQRRNVLVHKFVCTGTIEQRIDELIAEKQALSDDLLAGGAELLLTEMSDDQLISMVALDVNKALGS